MELAKSVPTPMTENIDNLVQEAVAGKAKHPEPANFLVGR